MSKVTELAEHEAEQVEQEPLQPDEAEQEEEAATEEEQAAPAEVEPTPEQETAEAQMKALDSEMRRHEKALGKLLEVELPLPRAEYPGVLGFIMPGAEELRENENFIRCTTCNGHGVVLTGSIRAGEVTADCPNPRCKGHGYWQRVQMGAPTQATPPEAAPAQANGQQDEWADAAWMGDPTIRPQPAPVIG